MVAPFHLKVASLPLGTRINSFSPSFTSTFLVFANAISPKSNLEAGKFPRLLHELELL